MAKQATYLKIGDVLPYTNGTVSTITKDQIVDLSTRIGIAADDIPVGVTGELWLEGVFEAIPAINTAAFTLGENLYWDADTGKLTNDVTETPAGWCVVAKLEAGTTTTIKLGVNGLGNGAVAAADVAISGSTTLADWRKEGALTKIDGADIADGSVAGSALAAAAFTADQITVSGAVTLADWRKGGDLEKIDGADISNGTISGAALAAAANVGLTQILVDGVTTLDSWQKAGDLTKFDGAKISSGTVALAALAATLRTFIFLSFRVDAADIANGDLMTDLTLPAGLTGEIVKLYARVTKAITTDAKAADINLELNTTNLTGGVISLAGLYAKGAVIEGTAITGNNVIASEDELSIEASGVTPFIEGEIEIIVVVKAALVTST